MQIIDVSDVDEPRVLERAAILGDPVEMYVRESTAYVVVSDPAPDGGVPAGRIDVIEVGDPARPFLRGSFAVRGEIFDTRIVGDVLYVVSNRVSWYDYFGDPYQEMTTVVSINLADPRAPFEVERIEFPGLSTQIHVTPTRLYVGAPNRDETIPTTRFTVLEIADPLGDMDVQSAFEVQGWLAAGTVSHEMLRFQMAATPSLFCIVTHSGGRGRSGSQHLTVVDVQEPTQPVALSSFSLPQTGGLWATRFDEDRVYLVTLIQVDSQSVLQSIDLAEPAAPKLMPPLEFPGLLRLVLPRGDRLLAVGSDDWARHGGVSLTTFDATGPPQLLDREEIGADRSWSPAIWDDRAFTLMADDGLALIPFSGGTLGDDGRASSLALVDVDLATGDLMMRGRVLQQGTVMRALPALGPDLRILSLSERSLQVVDVSDRDHPRITATVDLFRMR